MTSTGSQDDGAAGKGPPETSASAEPSGPSAEHASQTAQPPDKAAPDSVANLTDKAKSPPVGRKNRGGARKEDPTGAPARTQPPAQVPRPLPERRLYQDEVYGSKELSPFAVALMDTPEFQRLGHIYQLGTTYVAFRGANHKRFEHCVGTYFMSRTLLRRVVQNHARLHGVDGRAFRHPGAFVSPVLYIQAPGTPPNSQYPYSPMGRWRGLTEVISAAALLHDLGHVAIGHTLEDEFSVLSKHDGLGGYRLFDMLYGPRTAHASPVEELATGSLLSALFGPIDELRLPRPRTYDLRIPLPWVLENGTYEQVIPSPTPPGFGPALIAPLSNEQLRDLIYLILSFKETVTEATYATFTDEIASAIATAGGKRDLARLARLRFIESIYRRFSAPWPLGDDLPSVPVFHPFMADVVGNTICADLLDYLVRDGKRLNLETRNNPRLQRYLVVRPEASFVGAAPVDAYPEEAARNLRLTIYAVYKNGLPRRDTVSDLLDLMRERFRFAEVVYYHPKKCAYSAMLAKAMELAATLAPRDDENIYPAPWTRADGMNDGVPHIAHLGDDGLAEYLAGLRDTTHGPAIAALVRQVHYRDEYRLLFTLDAHAAAAAGGPLKFITDLRNGENGRDAGRRELEVLLGEVVRRSSLQDRLGTEPAILLYCPNIRMQAKEVAARAEIIPGRVVPLNRQGDESSLGADILSLNIQYQRLWRLYIFVNPLLVRDTNGSGVVVYSTIVDVFGDRFGVPNTYRKQGARLGYLTLRERVQRHYAAWRALKNAPFLNEDSVRSKILDIASVPALWGAVLHDEGCKYPVSEVDFNMGLARAAMIAAATDASARQREEWQPALRDLDEASWLARGETPGADRGREAALARLAGLENGLGGERVAARGGSDQPMTSWDEFVGSVARKIQHSG